MKTYIIDKQTAKLIAQVRRAQHDIDAIELADEFRGKFRPPDSVNVAYLKNGVMFPPFRCDLVEKWCAIADRQQYYGVIQPDPEIHFGYTDKGEIVLQCGQSSVKLYPINEGSELPIHPLPIVFDGNRIKLDFDAQAIISKAKTIKSTVATDRKAAKASAEARKVAVMRAEYERCKAIVTPEAIKRCAKRVKRLRALKSWRRAVNRELASVPSLPQLIANPLFNAFDPSYSEAYGDARLQYIEATKKRDNFKPRSWRSKGLENHNENVLIAFNRVGSTAQAALEHHEVAVGFEGGYDQRRYDANDVRRCRGFMRDHQTEYTESEASNLSTAEANTAST